MIELEARIGQVPPDHTGTHDLEKREIRVTAADYPAAVEQVEDQLPVGWRLLSLRTVSAETRNVG